MTFQKLNPSTVAIKSGGGMLTATTDGTLKVGDYLIEGPGEYDVAGIGLHVFAEYAMATSESMHVCLVWNPNAKLAENDEAGVDILVSLLESNEAVTGLIQANDPRVVVFIDETIANQVATHDGITVETESSYKVTQPALPAETRVAVLLS